MKAQYIVAVASSLTTAGILYMAGQVYRLRKVFARHAADHRYLMRAMLLVLRHLNLETQAERYRDT